MRELSALLLSAFLLCLISPSFSQITGVTNVLYTNQIIYTNQYLQYGNYKFGVRADCNVVLLDGTSVVWTTGLSPQSGLCGAVLQGDGNFVLYNSNRQPLWASNTAGPSGKYVVILQPDRNVVLYGPSRIETGTSVP